MADARVGSCFVPHFTFIILLLFMHLSSDIDKGKKEKEKENRMESGFWVAGVDGSTWMRIRPGE